MSENAIIIADEGVKGSGIEESEKKIVCTMDFKSAFGVDYTTLSVALESEYSCMFDVPDDQWLERACC